MVTKNKACVTLIRAVFCLPRDKCIEATTEQPAPTINPTPVKNINTGIKILIAAMPSLPTPCPTNIPSIAVTADILNMPNKVGMKYLLNKVNTFTVFKSIASLFII